MSRREKAIAVVLLALAILCLFIFRPKFMSSPGQAVPGTPSPKNVTVGTILSPVEAPQEYKHMLEKVLVKLEPKEPGGDVADPFKKFDAKDLMDRNVLEFSELKLIGIVLGEDAPTAMINDQILHDGDTISGFRIMEIRPNEVLLTRGLEKYTLKLFEEQ